MKRLFSIVTALIFLFNIMGYYVIYEMKRVKIRSEMKTMVREGATEGEIFNFNTEQFAALTWLDTKEFLYNGNLYDVIDMTCIKGVFVIKCINDTKEQDLYAGFSRMNSSDRKTILSLSGGIISIALPEKTLKFEENTVLSEDTQTACKTFHSSYFESPASPPPKSLV